MALVPLCPGSTNLAWDEETLEYVIYAGNLSSGSYTILGVAKQGTTINDYRGNRALVSVDGALKAGDWGGVPVMGSDATGANAYVDILVTPRAIRYLHVAVAANGAIISLNGGVSDAFAIPANTERLFPAQDIAEGATIQGKNLAAGSNYTNLYVSVW
ncbi:hypothetical protein LCGC14_1141480 [marine sediment metagenome]|uniref:Uncharacterized protein n=1 Tax=marine sediment metagenome TaxID=412755 RepID=A0A0F9PG97_9ZZZZ